MDLCIPVIEKQLYQTSAITAGPRYLETSLFSEKDILGMFTYLPYIIP
jgi:hypothetical protein